MEFKALLTPRKTILDAEATALICGLDAALAFPFAGSIFLLSDCRAALRILLDSSTTGPLNYLNTPLKRLAQTRRPVFTAWVNNHTGHLGNDLEAKDTNIPVLVVIATILHPA